MQVFRMQISRQQSLIGYYLTILMTMCLNILPLPDILKSFNPDWVLLGLIYWVFAVPDRIGVFNAGVIGLFVDILTGRLLGQYALIYALIIYVCLKGHRRLSNYLMPQQMVFIFFCLLFSRILSSWIGNMQGYKVLFHVFLFPVFSGALIWPLLCFILGYLFRFRRFG